MFKGGGSPYSVGMGRSSGPNDGFIALEYTGGEGLGWVVLIPPWVVMNGIQVDGIFSCAIFAAIPICSGKSAGVSMASVSK